jgi:hypothetical protein
VFFGPIVCLIEKEISKLEYFVKNIPVDERPQHLLDEIFQDGAKYFGTDFTTYEASFTPQLMLACEIELYEYMTSLLPDQRWIEIVKQVLTSDNICVFKHFILRLMARRMSGEMCTSLGNGFTNIMAVKFCCHKAKTIKLKGRVDGDDGIFSCFGDLPTPQQFSRLGLNIKIVPYEGPTLGSFCGMVMDPDERINIADPIEILLSSGWTTREYENARERKLRQLLKCKGYSYLYQYTGCPIVDALARYILRVTKEEEYRIPISYNGWQRWKLAQLFAKYKNTLPYRRTGMNTRLLMEKHFKVTVEDQKLTERYLNLKHDISPLEMPWLMKYTNKDQQLSWDRYAISKIHLPCEYFGTNHRLKSPVQALQSYEQQTKKTI